MKVKNTYSVTRADTVTEFFSWPEEKSEYVRLNYVDTGKILGSSYNVSQDGLTATASKVWASIADYIEYLSDANLMQTRMDQIEYCLENGMVQENMSEQYLES